MNVVQLYQNPAPYPHYTRTLTKYKSAFQATPRNQDLQSGYVDLPLTFADVAACNYLAFTRDGVTVYAWVTNAEELGGNGRFRLTFKTDALRTFQHTAKLGAQYVTRGPTVTRLYDELLGSSDPYPEVTHEEKDFGNPHTRTLVVQVRDPKPVGEDPYPCPSNTPVNPTLYSFYLQNYDARTPLGNDKIRLLIKTIKATDPNLVVTMYSVPYVDLSDLTQTEFLINETNLSGHGWYKYPETGPQVDRISKTIQIAVPSGLTEVDSSMQILIPDAGLLTVPKSLLAGATFGIRRDIDIFSGLTNYALTDSAGRMHPYSIRGSATNSIPVIGDPLETYLSQNQNALTTAVMGDVATIATGVVTAATGNPAGGLLALGGLQSMASKQANLKDAANNYSNPPAFLGSALAAHYTDKFFIITKKTKVTNATMVNSNYGYPQGRIMTLSLPATGYIQTRNCAISGPIPQWAIDEINARFDRGLMIE